MLLRHNTLVHQYIYGTVPFQSLTRCHTRIRSRSRTREKPILRRDDITTSPRLSRLRNRFHAGKIGIYGDRTVRAS